MPLQYGNGDFAPGISYGDSGKWKCGHHLLLAHAFAVKKYKDNYQKKQGGKIGMALWTEWSEPWRQDQAGGKGSFPTHQLHHPSFINMPAVQVPCVAA